MNDWNNRAIRFSVSLIALVICGNLPANNDEQAEDMFFRLVKQLAEKEGVTEQLKAENQMLWVQRMNNIRNRATEIVNAELIYV